MCSEALRRALQQPVIYPEPTTTVEMRETHISLVFLTDDYVYKIKKPVNLGFLDFSNLHRRRFYCEQELELNQRLSTDVYLEVVPIRQDNSRYTFHGDGAVVEYALKMRRLPAERSLEALLQQGALPPETMERLAQHLVAFHTAHPLPGPGPYGSVDQARADWEENFVQTADRRDKTLLPKTYEHIRQAVTVFMARHAEWFTARVRQSRIRDCHGDLRAEHVYCEPEHIQIIDCIEFNQRFRYIDVASEVAFLTIDLERLGAVDLAQHFVQAYVQCSGDMTLYRLLDFYRCYRAYVRGKVTGMQLEALLSPEQHAVLTQRAERFFTLAAQYATRLSRPLLLITTGLIASGKSTVATGVAAALDMPLLRSDVVRKALAGLSPQTSAQDAYGAGIYSASATRHTYDVLVAEARAALTHGYSVLLDASFAQQAERQRLAALAQEVGADYCLLECQASEEVLRTRLQARQHMPASISDAREDILAAFQRDYEPIQAGEAACHVSVDTTRGVEHCVQQALAAIDAR